MTRLVAIHQPNFFPWLGYFQKIRRADVFVLLDTVQHQKTGGTWSNRVMLNVGGTARWATAPIVRSYHGTRRVREIEFDNSLPWREKLLRMLEINYRRTEHFAEGMQVLRPLVLNPEKRMWAYNFNAIQFLVARLVDPAAELVLASDLSAEGNATDLLISLVRGVGGDAYLSGGGADEYQETDKFQRAGIRLVYQSYQHPAYPQHGIAEFIPGLSIIDALLNCGLAETRRLLGEDVP